jgi:hypothetical protein
MAMAITGVTILKHPVATGVTNDYFHEAGRTIRLMLDGKLKL